MEERFYRTGQIASKASISVRALRYYDRMGLLPPSHFTESGNRLYTEEDWLLLRRILLLKYLGFSLDEIKACLPMKPQLLYAALIHKKVLLHQHQNQLTVRLQCLEDLIGQLASGQWDESSLDEIIGGGNIMPLQTTLETALKMLGKQLVQDDRSQFLPLLDAQVIKNAIRTAQTGYEPVMQETGKNYYYLVIEPILQQIIGDDVFPANVQWEVFYELPKSDQLCYQGLGVSLEIWTPTETFKGFSLPILDVWYGRWVE